MRRRGSGCISRGVLHGAGGRVVLAARRTGLIEAEAAALGEGAFAVPMDVADERSVIAAFETIAATHGVCDVVVNNAGIAAPGAAISRSGEDWDQVVDVNLRGAFLVAREAAQQLVKAGLPGSLINIASILGTRTLPGWPLTAPPKPAYYS